MGRVSEGRCVGVKPGDRVTVVHGLDDDGRAKGVIRSGPRASTVYPDGLVWLVGLDNGGDLWIEDSMLDAGVISLGPGRHRVTDPDTSRLAAEAVEERLTEHQWAVLTSLVEAGRDGLIDHDHEARNGLIPTSAGKRRKELERLGLVAATERRRSTPSGQLARVWAVTARGIAVYQHHQRGAA